MRLFSLSVGLTAATLLAANTSSALDFTPREGSKELEGGYKVPVLGFQDGKRSVRYAPPPTWRYSGSPTSFLLLPNDNVEIAVKLSIVDRTAQSGSVANANDPDLQRYVVNLLPKDAESVEPGPILESPFLLGPLSSREWQFRFKTLGKDRKRSIAVVDLDEKYRLLVDVAAPAPEFAAIRDAVIRSLFSWEWER